MQVIRTLADDDHHDIDYHSELSLATERFADHANPCHHHCVIVITHSHI